MTRFGAISYINCLPFVAPLLLKKIDTDLQCLLAPPKYLNEKMTQKELPFSFVSAYYYLQNKDQLDLIEGVGIGACNQVDSVCFYHPEALDHFDQQKIALDPESQTSNAVLKWYLTQYKQEKPIFVFPDSGTHAPSFLRIGDKCLTFSTPKGYRKIDLGKVWYEVTGSPLPFAVVVAQKGIEGQTEVQQTLLKALEWSQQHLEEILPLAKQQVDLSEEAILRYWQLLTYLFDHSFIKALKVLETHVANAPLREEEPAIY